MHRLPSTLCPLADVFSPSLAEVSGSREGLTNQRVLHHAAWDILSLTFFTNAHVVPGNTFDLIVAVRVPSAAAKCDSQYQEQEEGWASFH